jgi:peptide/nickel transport system permease protein
MLPNGIAPVLVNSSFSIAGAILLESTLSFLGMGLGAEDPSWGQLLNQARSGGTGFNWWIATFPGLAIFLTVFSYVMIGEAMRDALDPRLKKRE